MIFFGATTVRAKDALLLVAQHSNHRTPSDEKGAWGEDRYEASHTRYHGVQPMRKVLCACPLWKFTNIYNSYATILLFFSTPPKRGIKMPHKIYNRFNLGDLWKQEGTGFFNAMCTTLVHLECSFLWSTRVVCVTAPLVPSTKNMTWKGYCIFLLRYLMSQKVDVSSKCWRLKIDAIFFFRE